MIYFTKNIPPFTAANGMRVSPIPCTLKEGIDFIPESVSRTGFYLGDDWANEIGAKLDSPIDELWYIEREHLVIEEI